MQEPVKHGVRGPGDLCALAEQSLWFDHIQMIADLSPLDHSPPPRSNSTATGLKTQSNQVIPDKPPRCVLPKLARRPFWYLATRLGAPHYLTHEARGQWNGWWVLHVGSRHDQAGADETGGLYVKQRLAVTVLGPRPAIPQSDVDLTCNNMFATITGIGHHLTQWPTLQSSFPQATQQRCSPTTGLELGKSSPRSPHGIARIRSRAKAQRLKGTKAECI